MIVSNSAYFGGGADGGTLYNCTLTGKSESGVDGYGGGACCCTLYNCALTGNSASFGGGASGGTLYNCTLSDNSAYVGGGVDGSEFGTTLYNCTLNGNSATDGGGADGSTLYNCTVVDNVASQDGGGVAWSCSVTKCIVAYNAAWTDDSYTADSILDYCCTAPLPTNGFGNISVAPLFVDYANGNLRLQFNSPCINAGNTSSLTSYNWDDPSFDYVGFTNIFDLDGNPRISGGTVDMGAYEFQDPPSIISYAWLQQYGLPTDGSVDSADLDGTGFNVYQDWIAGLNPTNALSVLRVVSAVPNGTNVTVTWQSVAGVNYFLECSTNMAGSSCFTCVATNIPGQSNLTSFVHTNATGPGPLFYRVGIKSQ